MSASVYPTLPGVRIEITRTALWNTLRRQTTSGRTYTGSFMVYPNYRFTLAYDLLRKSATKTEYQTLMAFFNTMKGGYDSFLFTDPDDYSVTADTFGTGDGSTTAFQLFRSFGTFVDPIFDLNGAPSIYVDGVLKSTPGDYSISATGVVTFTSAPANNKPLTWTGSYYWRCGFDDDEMDFEKFMYQMWQVQRVTFSTRKP